MRSTTTGLTEQAARERNGWLTTTGRVTGRDHEIEIWFAVDPESAGATVFLLSGGGDRSDWVRNVRVNPAIRLRAGGATWDGSARVIERTEALDLRAREVVSAKYQGWSPGRELSDWARTSRAVVIEIGGYA